MSDSTDTVIERILELQGCDPRPHGPSRRLLVSDPEGFGAILHSTAFERTDFVGLLAGPALLASDGDRWRARRRIVQPAFPPRRPEAHLEHIEWAMPAFIERLEDLTRDRRPTCLLEEVTRIVGRIIYRSVFGIEIDPDDHRIARFEPMLHAAGELMLSLVTPGGRVDGPLVDRVRRTRIAADEEIDWILDQRRTRPVEGVDDALGRLLAAREEGLIDDEGIRDEVRALVLASTETSSNSLVWCLRLLAGRPEIRATIEQELDADDETRLEAAILETLRLYPPVWSNERQATVAIELANHQWAIGDRAVLSVYRLHRDPALWPDPDRFDPDRFIDPEGGPRRPPHRFAYLPFGAGRHLCVGRNLALLEMNRILRTILGGFRIEFEDPDAIEPMLGVVIRAATPITVRVAGRDPLQASEPPE
ncbi:MAG: cytochrome P450 [Phycisphaeraceae bacterium]|nr:cytochrome P450 [Phycisphaeraceae bacterium]